MEQQDSNQCNSSSRAHIEPSKPTAHSLQLHYIVAHFSIPLFLCVFLLLLLRVQRRRRQQGYTQHRRELHTYITIHRSREAPPSNYIVKEKTRDSCPLPWHTDCGQNYLSDSKVYSKTHFTRVCCLQMS